MWSIIGMFLMGKLKDSENNMSHCHSITNCTWTGLGFNLGLCVEWTVTNWLRHDTG